MNKNCLGHYFVDKNGNIYQAVAYIDNPAIELKDIQTGNIKVVVIGSFYAEEFNKLYMVNTSRDEEFNEDIKDLISSYVYPVNILNVGGDKDE